RCRPSLVPSRNLAGDTFPPVLISCGTRNVKSQIDAEDVCDHMHGQPGIALKESLEQDAVDFRSVCLRQLDVGVSAEIHQFPEGVNGGVTEVLILRPGMSH